MNFQELLNDYFKNLSCSQSDLATASGLSLSVISRYLSGERTPYVNSPQLTALADGLASLAQKTEILNEDYTTGNILAALNEVLVQKEEQNQFFTNNFNTLIDFYGIKIKDLAVGINFDASFLYRIRSGERRPSDLVAFCNLIASYISDKYQEDVYLKKASLLLQCDCDTLNSDKLYKEKIQEYLLHNTKASNDFPNVSDFLVKMDDFNLEEFIKVIHFDDIKIPTLPLQFPTSHYYYGIAEMRKAELDFFKTTVLSKSKEPIFMYGDMPMVDMAEDMDFNKKWMFGIAAAIKKGLHINIIHDLDRPFEEILLGLEAWIPIYMTGQVTPYHLEGYENHIFHQLNYCSGSAVLFGECIDGAHNNGRYYLSNAKSDLVYYHTKAEDLLKHAKPLMDIYTLESQSQYLDFCGKNFSSLISDVLVFSGHLPLYTLPEDLYQKLLTSLSEEDCKKVSDYRQHLLTTIPTQIKEHLLTYRCHILSEEEFKKNKPNLSLPDLFLNDIFEYNYEDYLSHVKATEEFHAKYPGFILDHLAEPTFQNIQLTLIPNQFCIISKCKSPNIHFVLRHQKMLEGIEHFKPLKKD